MDLRLIQEFSGDGSINVIEWLEKAELVCSLRGITSMETVLPLRLTGGAFAVYQQLTEEDKRDSGKIKLALRTAFAVDSFTAYELFVSRRLQPGETVDVFLAELRRLAVPFGGLPDKALVCAFVAGLPESVKQLLRAGSRIDELSLIQILARARAVLTDESGVAAVTTPASAVRGNAGVQERAVPATQLRCYACNEMNHLARDREGDGMRTVGEAADEAVVEAKSGATGVTVAPASSCPGNERGVRPSAPVCTPDTL